MAKRAFATFETIGLSVSIGKLSISINAAFDFPYHHGLIGALGNFRHDVAITINGGTARAINAFNPFDGFFFYAANTNTFSTSTGAAPR